MLDAACGTGLVARLAFERVGDSGSVAGLDVNPGMLAIARNVSANPSAVKWYETSVEAMPIQDACFDVVLCQMGLQFVSDKVQGLKEMRRVLSPGGRVLLNLPGPTPEPMEIFAESLGRHISPKFSGFVRAVFAVHDADELHRMMTEAGFVRVEIDKEAKRLRVSEPEDFLWQYIYSTPLAELIEQSSSQQRDALAADIRQRWQKFAADDGMWLDVPMTTVRGQVA